MRSGWLMCAVLLAACPGKGGAKVANPDNAGEGSATGFFDVIAVPGAHWEMRDTMHDADAANGGDPDTPGSKLVLTVADVHTVGAAKVVTIGAKVLYDGNDEPEDAAGYRFAVAPQGVWRIDDDADDAAIGARLAEPPDWASPPADTDNEYGNTLAVRQQNGQTVACIGDVPDLGEDGCEDVCGGEMCIAEKDGVVGVDGDWAPDPYAIYQADGYTDGPGN